jgi:alpha-amylase/alpha-mannosidase (GH57 family)
MTQRYVSIHGHFYQPPRENPWLEAIEVQDSAYPYHDWNERVTAECYAPNSAARILDAEGRIARIVSNYERISFNFGPTLLAWMEVARPELYRAILEADRRSMARFGGHGSAIAQAHSHIILPLASERDRRTQVRWGVADFRHRFGREPEGLWLPETAVDVPSLEALAAEGLRFTILAPHQATRVRPLPACEAVPTEGDERQRVASEGAPPPPATPAAVHHDGSHGDERPTERPWQEVTAATLDTTRPYICRLPSGRSIAVYFYDGPLSHELSFGDLLSDGDRFARRLLEAFPDRADGEPRLVHVATDGETYGHHHRYGEMALAYALDRLDRDDTVRLTNYGELLELHPPEHEVEIAERTSWSCAHGLERWCSDCGCATGGEAGWNQRWRAPLREALDWLRDELAPLYEAAAGELLHDPWAARDGYLEVILDRSEAALERFLTAHSRRELSPDERLRARRLLELQRHAMTMFTSCGWFFNDLAGIETVQVLQYADRVLQLAQRLFGDSLEERFVERRERAESNRPAPLGGSGREIFERQVRPARVTLMKVAAHYALSSLFEDYPEEARIFCYRADQRDVRLVRSGRAQLAVGRLHLTSLVTGSEGHFSFAVLHLGDHHLNGGVRRFQGEEPFETMATEVAEAFHRADFTRVVRILDRHFEEMTYTLDSLFRDERRLVLDLILASTRADAEAQHRRVYEDHAPLMQYLSELGIPLPRALKASAEVVLELDLRRAFEAPEVDLDAAEERFRETASWHLELDTRGLALVLEASLERMAAELEARPDDLALLRRLDRAVELAGALPFTVSLYGAQGPGYRIVRDVYPERRAAAAAGDPDAAAWAEELRALAEKLELRLE